MSVFKVGSNKSSQNQYPSVRPTLDLDFANSKTLDPRITFTRASGGSYVGADGLIKLAGVNEPRFDHNPLTGESLGFLVEEARTNNLLYSEQFDNAYWTKDNTTVTPNAAIAPDGTLTADLLYTTTSGVALTYRNAGGISSAPYTTTIYLKSAGFTWAFVFAAQGNHYAFFNLVNGTVGTQTAGITAASISPVGNGWYRCSVTQTVSFLSFYVGPADANGSTASTASGTSGIFVWGAQLEAGDFPTSYIPTEASTRTRADDVASITGTNFSSWYNQSEGTLKFDTLSKGNAFAGYLQGAANSNRIDPYQSNSYPILVVVNSGTNLVNATSSTLMSLTAKQQFAVGIKQGAYALAQQGAVTITGTNATAPPTVTQMFLGRQWTPLYLNGTIARLTYYPKRLPDAQLQALTR